MAERNVLRESALNDEFRVEWTHINGKVVNDKYARYVHSMRVCLCAQNTQRGDCILCVTQLSPDVVLCVCVHHRRTHTHV